MHEDSSNLYLVFTKKQQINTDNLYLELIYCAYLFFFDLLYFLLFFLTWINKNVKSSTLFNLIYCAYLFHFILLIIIFY